METNSKTDKKRSLLTRSEWKVYEQLLLAKSNKEIGNALNISERTAGFHVSHILQKLGLSRRIEILARNRQL